ncbi:MAG: hypothetical protein ACMXX5_01185 [Candidatus Woesearchaeota archaeon]
MVERLILADKSKIAYEGIFIVRELYEKVDYFTEFRGYQKRELSSSETITKTGRKILHKYELWKQLSDYSRSVIRINMTLDEVKDIEIEKEGLKKHANQGKTTILMDAVLENDFEHRWENKPGFFFMRVLFDKYIFKPFTTDYQGFVMRDFTDLRNELSAILNLYKY